MSRIAKVDVLPLALSTKTDNQWDCDGTVDTLVVRISDEDGRYGIGECDAPPAVVKAFLEMPGSHIWSMNPIEMLIGLDPLEVPAIWQKLYEATSYPGRRGLGIHALSAIDIALYDLAGKQIGKPVYKLLGGAKREFLTPYATVFQGMPQGRCLAQMMDVTRELFDRALHIGFRAVKMEVLFYDLVTDQQLVEVIKEGRRMLGDEIRMMLDFGYRWRDWHAAKWVLDRVEDCNIYFAEATLQHDDLYGHAHLSESTGIRICGAEHAATRWEIHEWIQTGKVAVVQPDINRCGGLSEIRRIAELAEIYGVQVIPHGWKTGITAACGRHFQASTLNAEVFEFLSPHLYDSPLRQSLVSPEPTIMNGRMELPATPGLGIEMNQEVVERGLENFRVSGRKS
jgi:L-alanine-DL-glutamate epimerase-like enolase superfamily enzyme